jgi:peptide deformylase
MPAATTKDETPPVDNAPKSPYDVPFDDSKIVKYGEAGAEVLKKVASEIKVVDSEVRNLIKEMGSIMYAARGVGLAAPQVGRSIRLLVFDAGDGLQALINPRIVKMKGEQREPEEGCLSIPGLRGIVPRAQEIHVQAQDGDGRPIRFRTTGFEARIIQHEVDHLDGILFIDRADAKTLRMMSEQEKEEERNGESAAPAE